MTGSVKAYLSGVIKCTVFGLTFLFIKRLLVHLTMFELLAYRFLLAALAFELLRRCGVLKINLKGKDIRPLLTIALFQPICYFLFETFGLERVTSLMGGILVSVLPLFTLMLEAVFLKERTTVSQRAGILLSVCGVALISAMTRSEGGSSSLIGIFCVLLAVLSESMFSIYSRKWMHTFSGVEMVYVMMWTGAAVFNLINLGLKIADGSVLHYFAPMMNLEVFLELCYLGVLASCLAFLIYEYMLLHLQASVVNTFAGLTTLVTIAADILIGHEAFEWYHILGTVLIFAGLIGAVAFQKEPAPVQTNAWKEG